MDLILTKDIWKLLPFVPKSISPFQILIRAITLTFHHSHITSRPQAENELRLSQSEFDRQVTILAPNSHHCQKNHFHQSIKISQFELEQSWRDWSGKTKFPNCRLRSPSFWWRVSPKAKQTTFAIFKLPSKLRSDLSWRRCLWENKCKKIF